MVPFKRISIYSCQNTKSFFFIIRPKFQETKQLVYWCNVFEIPRMEKAHHVIKVFVFIFSISYSLFSGVITSSMCKQI